MNKKISFIGLGIMGSRMATNLLKNGIKLTVYNRSQDASLALQRHGATIAATLDEAVKDADIIFTMLSTPDVIQTLFLGKNGAIHKIKKEAIWVDCSTVNPSFSKETAKTAQAKNIHYIDAPVAGTKPHAENAQLTFFVGAETALFEQIQHLLEYMGAKVLHLGTSGQGSAFKMLVNMLLAQSMIIFSEALLLGESMGLDKTFLLNTLPNLPVTAPFTKAKVDMIQANDYEVQFPLEWMHKDLHLATLSAYEYDQPLFMANLAKELFSKAKKQGLARLDFAAIHQFLAQQ